MTGVDWLPTLRHACGLATRGAEPGCAPGEVLPCEDGDNLLQLWQGRGRVQRREKPIFWARLDSAYGSYALQSEGSERGPFVMLQGEWKLILHAANGSTAPHSPLHAHPLELLISSLAHGERVPAPLLLEDGALVELFNLRADPTEWHNAAREQLPRLARMRTVLGEWIRSLPWPLPRQPPAFLLGNESRIARGTSRPNPAHAQNVIGQVLKAHTQGEWLDVANELRRAGVYLNHAVPECAYAA